VHQLPRRGQITLQRPHGVTSYTNAHDAFSYRAIELGREVADALVVPPLRPYASRSAAARAAESETEKLL